MSDGTQVGRTEDRHGLLQGERDNWAGAGGRVGAGSSKPQSCKFFCTQKPGASLM